MTKVKVILPFVQGKKSFGIGDEISLDQELAYSLAKKGVVEFSNKKEFTKLDETINAKQQAKLEEKEENERKAAAILRKHDLEKERMTLQNKIDAITHILDDAKTYYLPYAGLVDDLLKQEAKNVNESNENKKDDLSQGENK